MINAELILKHLRLRPMSRLELERATELTENSIVHALKRLRETVTVHTIQTGKRIVYEVEE